MGGGTFAKSITAIAAVMHRSSLLILSYSSETHNNSMVSGYKINSDHKYEQQRGHSRAHSAVLSPAARFGAVRRGSARFGAVLEEH